MKERVYVIMCIYILDLCNSNSLMIKISSIITVDNYSLEQGVHQNSQQAIG